MLKKINHCLFLVFLVFIFITNSPAQNYNPVALTSGSYNQAIVVQATAPQAIPYCFNVFAGSGTNLGDNTYYEQGLVARPGQVGGNSGIPVHNTIFTNISNANMAFLMPPDYTTNNELMVDSTFTSGTITFNTATTATNLAILCTGGGGGVTVNYTVTHSNASTETGSISLNDWFNTGTFNAWGANGRIDVNGNYNNYNSSSVNNNAPFLHAYTITVSGASPVASITLTFSSGQHGNFYGVSGKNTGASVWTPISLNQSSFNVRGTVPALVPFPLTATMDQGTNLNFNGNLATFFEQGFYRANTNYGLPHPGQLFTNVSQSTHLFQLASSFTANHAILVDAAHTSANITPMNPTNYTAFSLLTAGGNIGGNNIMTNLIIMQHADGTSETNLFFGYDWFNSVQPSAWNANGRVNLASRTVNNINNTYPKLFESQFALGNSVSPVTNILLQYKTSPGANSTTYILAVSATAGSVLPIITSFPQSTNVNLGGTLTLTASVSGGTAPITNQWQFNTNGVWQNLSNSGNISGSTTTTLTITNAAYTNSADYRFVASNVAGIVSTPAVTVVVLSPLADVTVPGDPITDFGGTSPAGQGVTNAIDNSTSKYLNFGISNGVPPFTGPVGLVVAPSMGASVVSGLRIYTANDAVERDPADYALEGSTNGGANYTLISSNAIILPAARNGSGALTPNSQALQQVLFANAASYTSYRLTFRNVKNNATANSIQLGELELLGVQTPIPPTIIQQPATTITVYSGVTLTLRVSAVGAPPISYQWKKNGSTVVGTGTNLVLSGLAVVDSGNTFSCTVTNTYGTNTTSTTTLTVLAAPTNTYPVAVLTANPVGFWRLNEKPDNGSGNNGTVAHDYYGGNNGIYTNSEIGLIGYRAAVLDLDTAARFGNFAGSNSYVGQISNIDFGTATNTSAAFSIEAWVKGSAQSADGGIVTKGTGAGGEQFNLDTGSAAHAFRFFVRDAAGTVHLANGTIAPDGQWHHLVGVCDQINSNVLLYVDGTLNASGTIPAGSGIQASANLMSIGSRQGGATGVYNLQFAGVVDEVAVYSVALTAAQVQSHYYAAGIPTTTSLTSSKNPSGFLDGISITASVQTNSVTTGNATGNIIFKTNSVLFDSQSLSGGLATSVTTTNLPRGANTITAEYAGDGNYLGSTNTLNQIVTNHPPVASVMTVNRTAGFSLKVALADLATNWNDADSDAISLTQINFTTTNGVTLTQLNVTTNSDGSYVTNNNGFLGYTNNLNVADRFSYTIRDSFGSTNIGFVNIVVQTSVTGTNSITSIQSGVPTTVTAYGIPGYSYILERSTNLVNWVSVSTNVAAANGRINAADSFSDLGGQQPASANYRLKYQP